MRVPMSDGREVFLRPVAAGVAVDDATGAPLEPGLYLADLRLPSGAWIAIAPTVWVDGAGRLVYKDGDGTNLARMVSEGRVRWVYKVQEVRR